MKKKVASLSVFAVSMITITSVDSIRNLPGSATLGAQALFYFIAAALFYFIPIALVCAELTTTFPEQGGVYLWGKKALGKNFGFLSLWFQFAENIVFYPPLLIFIIATALYPFSHSASNNPHLMFFLINFVFWSITLVNIFGLKVSAIFTEVLGIFGTIIPLLLICGIGIFWFLTQKNLNYVHLTLANILPNFSHIPITVTFTTVILSFTGMEIATVYANEVKNPQKNYPKALFIATIFILLTLSFGSLAIATVVGPKSQTLNQGIVVFFTHFFEVLHLSWMTFIIVICIVLGGLASLNNWIIAPLKGLTVASKDGFLPERFRKENKNSAPVFLLLLQGIIVSILSSIFVFIPSVNEGMWFLNILMTQLYMFMYSLVFISFIVLRYKYPNINRPFKVPGGKIGMWIITLFGTLSCGATILIAFQPDSALKIHNQSIFAVSLFIGLFIFILPALVAILYKEASKFNNKNGSENES